jgi:hypothetical protein
MTQSATCAMAEQTSVIPYHRTACNIQTLLTASRRQNTVRRQKAVRPCAMQVRCYTGGLKTTDPTLQETTLGSRPFHQTWTSP